MNLYKGGFGMYQYYTVAEDVGMAIKQIQERNNMEHLPVTAELIDDIDGYKIKPIESAKSCSIDLYGKMYEEIIVPCEVKVGEENNEFIPKEIGTTNRTKPNKRNRGTRTR